MKMKKTTGAALGALILLGLGSPAVAGEATGNGKATPAGDRAASACAYSGLEDGETLVFDPVTGAPSNVETPHKGPGWVQNPHMENSPGVTYPAGIAGQFCRGNVDTDL